MVTLQVHCHVWWHFWRPSHQINSSSCPSGLQQGTFESSRTPLEDSRMRSTLFYCRTLMMRGKRTVLSLPAWLSWWASLMMTFSTDLICLNVISRLFTLVRGWHFHLMWLTGLKCHLKTFHISIKCPQMAFFTDEIEITSIPDAFEHLCYLTMLSTMVSSQ